MIETPRNPNAYIPDFKKDADNVRETLKVAAKSVFMLTKHPSFEQPNDGNKSEMYENIMLAFRHIEDCAMRVGKAIQAYTGGESPLGGPSTPQR